MSNLQLPTNVDFATRCAADGELRLAIRYWTGGLRFFVGDQSLFLTVENGIPVVGDPGEGSDVLTLRGPEELWVQLLRAAPPRFANDITPAAALGLVLEGEALLFAQYGAAAQRAVELLRAPADSGKPARDDVRTETPRYDAPIGRYVHVTLGGHDHRVYYEEAGQGIPLLLQHTAGSHGIQWRHVMECTEITDHFRVIAYDLPFHGKSIPPVSRRWWEERYRLDGEFLRSVPVTLAGALDLDRPVFMGCSVGGLLALDLAATHPETFRSVISLEGALKVPGDPESLIGFWHPQVSNESKARLRRMKIVLPIIERKPFRPTLQVGRRCSSAISITTSWTTTCASEPTRSTPLEHQCTYFLANTISAPRSRWDAPHTRRSRGRRSP